MFLPIFWLEIFGRGWIHNSTEIPLAPTRTRLQAGQPPVPCGRAPRATQPRHPTCSPRSETRSGWRGSATRSATQSSPSSNWEAVQPAATQGRSHARKAEQCDIRKCGSVTIRQFEFGMQPAKSQCATLMIAVMLLSLALSCV